MFTRVVQGKRPRPLALLAILGAVIVAGLFAAVALALVADADNVVVDCDIQVTNKQGTDACTTDAGARVRYIGDSNETFGSSGTGTFNPFVRLQASPEEAGYNTNGTLEFDSKAGNWTHAILISEIPVRTLDECTNCFELWVDINEGNNAKPVSLNEMEIWFTDNANLTGYPFAGVVGTSLQYDFSDEILIRDVNQGSGRGDLRYLVPTAGLAIPGNCSYGSTTCTTYFLLYSEWGTSGGSQTSDGGFEEWKVKVYPIPPVVTTLLSNLGPITIGTSVSDSATITGATADAGGTITYKIYSDNACTTLVADVTPTPNTVVNGVAPNSLSHQFNNAGTFYWQATYSGDADNPGPVSSVCTSETLVVNPNAPGPHSTPVVQIKDTLTVGGFSANVTGNVLVGFYTSTDCTTGQIGSNQSFAASSFLGGATQETTFVGVTTNTYIKISYAGDPNNGSFSSCAESVTVGITSLP